MRLSSGTFPTSADLMRRLSEAADKNCCSKGPLGSLGCPHTISGRSLYDNGDHTARID